MKQGTNMLKTVRNLAKACATMHTGSRLPVNFSYDTPNTSINGQSEGWKM